MEDFVVDADLLAANEFFDTLATWACDKGLDPEMVLHMLCGFLSRNKLIEKANEYLKSIEVIKMGEHKCTANKH